MNDAAVHTFASTAKRPVLALVLSAESLCMAKKFSKNRDLMKYVTLAKRGGFKFLVAGGELHRKNTGCIGILVKDSGPLLMAVSALHGRLTEIGADQSLWAIHAGDLTKKVQSHLAEISDTEGAMH